MGHHGNSYEIDEKAIRDSRRTVYNKAVGQIAKMRRDLPPPLRQATKDKLQEIEWWLQHEGERDRP